MIAKALSRALPELVKRYGSDTNSTKAQLARTCADLSIADEVYPYLCAACLSVGELAIARTEMTGVNWEEIMNRAKRMVEEYNRNKIPYSDRFYESGIGMAGDR